MKLNDSCKAIIKAWLRVSCATDVNILVFPIYVEYYIYIYIYVYNSIVSANGGYSIYFFTPALLRCS